VKSYDTKKDGSPYTILNGPNKGNTYSRVNFSIDKDLIADPTFTGELSLLDFEGVGKNWSDGDTVSGIVKKNGDYWNFELPKASLKMKVAELEAENKELKRKLAQYEGSDDSQTDVVDDIDGLPF
jgi:hypothetical protein